MVDIPSVEEASSSEDDLECFMRERSFLQESERMESLDDEKQKDRWKVYFGF